MISIKSLNDLEVITVRELLSQESINIDLLIAKAMVMATKYNTWDKRLHIRDTDLFPPLNIEYQRTHDYGFEPIRFNTKDNTVPGSVLKKFEPNMDNNILASFGGAISEAKFVTVHGKDYIRLEGEFVLTVSTMITDIVNTIDVPATFKNQIRDYVKGNTTPIHVAIHRTNKGLKYVRHL